LIKLTRKLYYLVQNLPFPQVTRGINWGIESKCMLDRFDELIIPRSTVESIGQQEIGHLMVGFTWRKDVWQKPHKFIQMVAIQIVGAGMIFTALMLPVDRVLHVYRTPPSQQERVTQLAWVDGTITVMILIGVNRWIFQRGKQLQRLLKLVAQIEHYNQIVTSIDTLEKLANLTNNRRDLAQANNMMEILNKTRQNLLVALQIESHSEQLRQRYLHQYPNSSELTLSIANNLIDLQNLAQQPQLAEYGMLLTQAWEIGMSVYAESSDL
jgi:glycogen debranching enzyme